MALLWVVDGLPCSLGILSPLNSSLGTATPVVVPTTVPDAGFIHILSTVLLLCFPSSQMSLPLEQLSSHLSCGLLRLFNVLPLAVGLVLYYTLPLESIHLIPNPNPSTSTQYSIIPCFHSKSQLSNRSSLPFTC